MGGSATATSEFPLCAATYHFCLYDSHGDGFCCDYGYGSYTLSVNDVEVLSGDGAIGAEDCKEFTACTTDSDCVSPYSCAEATCDNGACNFDFSMLKAGAIGILTDTYPGETSWQILDMGSNSSIVGSGSNYYVDNFFYCPEVEHAFFIKDSYGDGICCDYGVGSWAIMVGDSDNPTTVASSSDFSSEFGSLCGFSFLVNITAAGYEVEVVYPIIG